MAGYSANFVAASSQYLSRANSSPLNINSNSFTIEFWFKTPKTNSGVVIAKDDNSLGRNYTFYFDHTIGKIGVQFAGNAEAYNSTGMSADTWYHFAMSCNGTTAQYYLNGSTDGTGSYHSWTNGTGPTTLGARSYSGAENYLNCQLANVRIWNTVRTGTEINNNKSVIINSATGLVASWVLNNALTDGSGNSLTLTNNNGVTFTADTPFTYSTDYPITLSQGSFTYTGYATALRSTRKLIAAFGSYTLTGFAVGLSLGKGIVLATGNYALTGFSVALTSTRRIALVAGSYALTGYDVVLKAGKGMIMATGSYVLTGFSILMRASNIWTDLTKSATSFVNSIKNSSVWTDQDKH